MYLNTQYRYFVCNCRNIDDDMDGDGDFIIYEYFKDNLIDILRDLKIICGCGFELIKLSLNSLTNVIVLLLLLKHLTKCKNRLLI